MSIEVHIEWAGETHLAGHLHMAECSPAVSFEYVADWLERAGAFAIDPTSLPLRPGTHHSFKRFGAMQVCGSTSWGRDLIERAVQKLVLDSKPYQDIDYVLAHGCSPFSCDRPGAISCPPRGKAAAPCSAFGIKNAQATTILREVVALITDWRKTGKQLHLKFSTLNVYSNAFEHSLMEEARSW